jgi:hypothetical protein
LTLLADFPFPQLTPSRRAEMVRLLSRQHGRDRPLHP